MMIEMINLFCLFQEFDLLKRDFESMKLDSEGMKMQIELKDKLLKVSFMESH